jgi:hypothetical protein|tara:strand:- start:4113 stop:4547 length:435 start_codon:yes stop_codon:yes gene_type:complete
MKKEGDYKKDIEIGKGNLKEEWERQAGLYLFYSLKTSDAEVAKSNAKEELEVTDAGLDKKIRTNPDKFDLEKVTDKVVANTILLQEKHKIAFDNYVEMLYELSILRGVMVAFDHKKKALENLVTLHVSGYNAEPKPDRKRRRER